MSSNKYPQVIVFGLKSGAHILAMSAGETDTAILLDYPLEIIYEDAGPELMVMNLIRYLPFSDMNQTLVNHHAIESMTVCSERFNELYAIKKASFEAQATPVDDSPTTMVEDRTNELAQEDGEEQDFVPLTPNRRTYH